MGTENPQILPAFTHQCLGPSAFLSSLPGSPRPSHVRLGSLHLCPGPSPGSPIPTWHPIPLPNSQLHPLLSLPYPACFHPSLLPSSPSLGSSRPSLSHPTSPPGSPLSYLVSLIPACLNSTRPWVHFSLNGVHSPYVSPLPCPQFLLCPLAGVPPSGVSLSVQPPGAQVALGDCLVLSCAVAMGTGPLFFSWHRGGSGTPLGTGSHVEVWHVGDNDSGHYHWRQHGQECPPECHHPG